MNPMQIINQVLNNKSLLQNPVINNAVGMYRQGNTDGLKSLAENLCREKGMDINDIRRRIGI